MRPTFLVVVFALAGCASQIMEGFVGKDISEVQLQYGPPVNVMDMADGSKAFQWRINSVMAMPSTTTYPGYTSGNLTTGTAYTSGGGLISSTCFYTLFAKANANKSYTVVGFQKPRLDCE